MNPSQTKDVRLPLHLVRAPPHFAPTPASDTRASNHGAEASCKFEYSGTERKGIAEVRFCKRRQTYEAAGEPGQTEIPRTVSIAGEIVALPPSVQVWAELQTYYGARHQAIYCLFPVTPLSLNGLRYKIFRRLAASVCHLRVLDGHVR
eukprot:scaffold7344_cov122-Amphora_coffeaeformis.AAC.2